MDHASIDIAIPPPERRQPFWRALPFKGANAYKANISSCQSAINVEAMKIKMKWALYLEPVA
jgi:hypothetical protein